MQTFDSRRQAAYRTDLMEEIDELREEVRTLQQDILLISCLLIMVSIAALVT